MPTAQRAPAALLVRRGGERLLFDCAEGTQRQLQRSAVGLPDLEEIFLTHFHADHFLGLPGMLKTFALRGREEVRLTVYGPRGLRELFGKLRPVPRPASVSAHDASSSSRGRRSSAASTRSRRSRSITGSPALGYALVEHERPGRFDVAAADALGVPPGRERGVLQNGEP